LVRVLFVSMAFASDGSGSFCSEGGNLRNVQSPLDEDRLNQAFRVEGESSDGKNGQRYDPLKKTFELVKSFDFFLFCWVCTNFDRGFLFSLVRWNLFSLLVS
jgi:hypothetical protein